MNIRFSSQLFLLFLLGTTFLFVGHVRGQTSEGQTKQVKKKFVHAGMRQNFLNKECEKIGGCELPDSSSGIESRISQAYVLLGLSGGGIPVLNKKSNSPSTKKSATKDAPKETTTDYCMSAAMVYEMVGKQIQEHLQKQAEQTVGEEDAQLQAVISLQQAHEARKKSSNFQAYFYGAVANCYLVKMFIPTIAKDFKFFSRMAGASALTVLYGLKANKHKNAANKVQEIITAMSSVGKNCSPWSRSSCFCKEPTSQNVYPSEYQEVCVLNKGNFDGTLSYIGCTARNGDKATYDPNCSCKENQSCYRMKIEAYNPQTGKGINLMSEVNKIFDAISSDGVLDKATLDKYSLAQARAISQVKIPGEEKIKLPNLKEEEKKLVDEFSEFMPKPLAYVMAKNEGGRPSNGGAQTASSIGESSLTPSPQSDEKNPIRSVGSSYQKMGESSTLSPQEETPDFSFPQLGQGDGSSAENTEILEFSEEATSKAEVSQNSVKPIFEIISYRYRASGWKKLGPSF